MIIENINLLKELFTSILQQSAFMFAEEIGRESTDIPDKYLLSTIKFTGYASGEISIIIPEKAAAQMFANMLGIDNDADAEKQRKDCVGEILNVLCGQYLTSAAGEAPVFNLSIPKTSKIAASQIEKFISGKKNSASLFVENLKVYITLEIGK